MEIVMHRMICENFEIIRHADEKQSVTTETDSLSFIMQHPETVTLNEITDRPHCYTVSCGIFEDSADYEAVVNSSEELNKLIPASLNKQTSEDLDKSMTTADHVCAEDNNDAQFTEDTSFEVVDDNRTDEKFSNCFTDSKMDDNDNSVKLESAGMGSLKCSNQSVCIPSNDEDLAPAICNERCLSSPKASEAAADILAKKTAIDTMFYACDVQENGLVIVSDVIHLIKNAIDIVEFNESSLEDLQDFLDPDRCDPQLDLVQFRSGISAWMHSIGAGIDYRDDEQGVVYEASESKCNSSVVDNDNETSLSYDVINGKIQNTPVSSHCAGGDNHSTPEMHSVLSRRDGSLCLCRAEPLGAESVMSNSLEISCCSDLDVVELQNRLATVEHQNKKLVEDLAMRTHQLEVSDEQCTQLVQQIDALNTIFKTQQASCERMTELRQENNELRQNLLAAEDSRNLLLTEKHNMEQCLTASRDNIDFLHQQIANLQSETDLLTEAHQQVKATLNQQIEEQVSKATEQYEKQLSECTIQLSDLKKQCAELSTINERLKSDKEVIEQQLSDALQTDHCQSLLRRYDDVSDSDIDDASSSLVSITRSPLVTPCSKRSLCNEITSSFIDEPFLPSPLCDKELEDVIVQLPSRFNSSFLSEETETTAGSCVVETISTASHGPQNSETTLCVGSLRWSTRTVSTLRPAVVRALLRRDINVMLQFASCHEWLSFEKFVQQFVDEVVTVLFSRNQLEKRNLVQSSLLRKLKDFQESEARRYQEALTKTSAEFGLLQKCIREQFAHAESREVVDVACGPSEDLASSENEQRTECNDADRPCNVECCDSTLSGDDDSTTLSSGVTEKRVKSSLPKSSYPFWYCDIVSVSVTVFVAGAIVFCLLVGFGQPNNSAITLRHLQPPPM